MEPARRFYAKANATPGVNCVKLYQGGFGKQHVMVCGEWDDATERALLNGCRNFA